MLAVMITVICLWGVGLIMIFPGSSPTRAQLVAADVYTRYSLAIPGAALTTWGLLLQRRAFQKLGMGRFGLDVAIAALAFAFYGGIGQLFASPSTIFPSSYINAGTLSELVRLSDPGISRLDGNHSRSVHHPFAARF